MLRSHSASPGGGCGASAEAFLAGVAAEAFFASSIQRVFGLGNQFLQIYEGQAAERGRELRAGGLERRRQRCLRRGIRGERLARNSRRVSLRLEATRKVGVTAM